MKALKTMLSGASHAPSIACQERSSFSVRAALPHQRSRVSESRAIDFRFITDKQSKKRAMISSRRLAVSIGHGAVSIALLSIRGDVLVDVPFLKWNPLFFTSCFCDSGWRIKRKRRCASHEMPISRNGAYRRPVRSLIAPLVR